MKVSDLMQRAEALELVIDRDHDDRKVLLYTQYLLFDMVKMPSTKESLELKADIIAMLCELESEHLKDVIHPVATSNSFKDMILSKGN